MKTKAQQQVDKGGFALLVVLFFVAAISTFLGMLAFSSSQRAYTAQRLTNKIKAQAMAEAGCEYGYAILSTDWAARYDPSAFGSTSTNGTTLNSVSSSPTSGYKLSSTGSSESYKIHVAPIGDQAALVTSTGTCGDVSSVSAVSVQNIGGANDDGSVLSGQAFKYAILCGGDLDFSGCGSIVSPSGQAKFHANGAISLKGNTAALIDLSSSTSISIHNNVTVGGDVTAPVLSYKSNKVTIGGTATQTSVDPVNIPDIDLTPYYNWALAHGEVYDSLPSGDLTPNGGIIWINGSASIKAKINGSVIATGDISVLTKFANVTPTTCAFSIASRDGDITMNGGEVHGLIYAKTGSLNYQGNGTIYGQIIVNGYIKNAGNSDIMTSFAVNVPSPPGGSTTTDFIAITAWQN